MYETNVTIVGNIVSQPVRRDLGNGDELLTFRLASNSRRLDSGTGEWVDAGALFLNVACWRRLVAGVDDSLRRGDPVVAYGRLHIHEFTTRDGAARREPELRAIAIGPDLARCSAPITRRNTYDGPGAVPRGVVCAAQNGSPPAAGTRADPESAIAS
ncbi:single-stranded DNA-binding protein [Nocardia panacis]|uniref:Single-stranded DNA-binding protein n=1 Tax=Nocardia panacis TaxID=2340916 RepID=A0A3A4K0H9_9NOCA|nr:single-stranded DNA-binding protein [Nocardia panacis]RJO77543.1 single-stranded DNA-binding protein [Nocardia panacis]